MTDWTHTIALIVPIAEEGRASRSAAQLSGNPRDRVGFFAVRLSATGQEPATHIGAHSALRGRSVASLPALRKQFKGGDYALTDGGAGFWELAASMSLQAIRSDDDEVPP